MTFYIYLVVTNCCSHRQLEGSRFNEKRPSDSKVMSHTPCVMPIITTNDEKFAFQSVQKIRVHMVCASVQRCRGALVARSDHYTSTTTTKTYKAYVQQIHVDAQALYNSICGNPVLSHANLPGCSAVYRSLCVTGKGSVFPFRQGQSTSLAVNMPVEELSNHSRGVNSSAREAAGREGGREIQSRRKESVLGAQYMITHTHAGMCRPSPLSNPCMNTREF